MSYRPIRSAYAVAAATLLGSALLAAPALAQTTPRAQTQLSAAGTTSAKPARAKQAQGDLVERRLTTLHKQLKLTSEQEPKWDSFAQAVRDNEARMKDLVMSRHQATQRNAVEDLQSYADITGEHANGIKRLVAPFQDLYGSMTDAQRKNADRVFARYEGRAEARESGQRPAKPKS